MKKKLIIWDWNGTLLNDVDACVTAMNIMLKKRNMPLLTTERYKQIFTFPVYEYYKALGFSTDDFEELSLEYIDLYMEIAKKSPLHNGVTDTLCYFHEKKYTQVILSAAEQSALTSQVRQRNIEEYFDHMIGLSDIYAKSKVDNAKRYINEHGNKFDQITFIGDTYHDYEVAEAIGVDCFLINKGHQNISAVKNNGYQVLASHNQLMKVLN